MANAKCQCDKTHKERQLTVEELVNNGMQRMKEAGFKYTKKRREILTLFAKEERYISAKFIHQALAESYPTMSYNTTYRNIYDFVEQGILEATEYNQEQMFRINCLDCEHHHHHFICTECGLTIPLTYCPLDAVKDQLEDVEIESHRFEIFGKCSKCK